jgi:hypothetical protein
VFSYCADATTTTTLHTKIKKKGKQLEATQQWRII